MLDPHSLDAALDVAHDLAGEAGRDRSFVARRSPGREGPSVAAWERRERTCFCRPLVLVEVEGARLPRV